MDRTGDTFTARGEKIKYFLISVTQPASKSHFFLLKKKDIYDNFHYLFIKF